MAANLAKDYGIVTAIIHHHLSQKGGNNGIKYPSHIKNTLNGFFNITFSLNSLNPKDSKIVVDGHSAGAHLSALLASDVNQYTNNNSLYIHQFIEPAFVTDESDAWKKASPQYSVTSNSLNKISHASLPKYLLIDSAEDTLISSQQTIQFDENLYDIVLKQFDFI